MKCTSILLFTVLALAPGCQSGEAVKARPEPALTTQPAAHEFTIQIGLSGPDANTAYYRIGSKRYETVSAMAEALSSSPLDKEETRVTLDCANDVPWQAVVDAYNVLVKAGFRRFDFSQD